MDTMSETQIRYTLGKEERLYAQKRIDSLFEKGNSFINYPLRIVFLERDNTEVNNTCSVSIMVSVSKKKFKQAVKRNRVKRLIKEAYRLNKNGFVDKISPKSVDIAFLYLKNELPQYSEIEKAMQKALSTLIEKININDENKKLNP